MGAQFQFCSPTVLEPSCHTVLVRWPSNFRAGVYNRSDTAQGKYVPGVLTVWIQDERKYQNGKENAEITAEFAGQVVETR